VERGVTKKSRKKGRAVSTEDLPFWQNRQKLAIKIKRWEKKVGPVTNGQSIIWEEIFKPPA
jgi:hypothetical protein